MDSEKQLKTLSLDKDLVKEIEKRASENHLKTSTWLNQFLRKILLKEAIKESD